MLKTGQKSVKNSPKITQKMDIGDIKRNEKREKKERIINPLYGVLFHKLCRRRYPYLFLYPIIKSARTLRYAGYAPVYNVREHTKSMSPMSILTRVSACVINSNTHFSHLWCNDIPESGICNNSKKIFS